MVASKNCPQKLQKAKQEKSAPYRVNYRQQISDYYNYSQLIILKRAQLSHCMF